MLQRAASNAYSWWWASHIRTKQSKWLEQSLQDMDEKVQSMLTLIEEDGDSFAKRAEMYYKRRPELISSVEEAYKAFRALADRYDLLSKELQNANHTIATVFPEQVQFAMAEDEEGGPNPKIPQNPHIPGVNEAKVPQVPKAPIKDLKNIISKASKQFQGKKSSKAQIPNKVEVKSGLTKDEALDEISKIQKDILALQTVKEFVKSSYESGIAKYWGIENQIMEMQQKVSRLQDEFDMETVIEDDEARTLMAEAALKSCQETLAMLQEKQEKTTREAREEYKRIEAACQRLQSLRQRYLQDKRDDENPKEGDGTIKVGDESQNLSKDVADLIQETKEIEALPEKTKESLDLSSLACLTVTQLAEKIDQLVNKVISLETAVSSQTVLVNTLRSETDDLNAQIRNLEEVNENLIDDTKNLSTRVKEMEEKLNKVQDLNKNVESQNSNLQTNFAEARTNLDHLSEKLSSVKADEELEAPTTLEHLSEKLSSVKADEELEAPTTLEHLSEKLSSVKADDELEARMNLDRLSEKLSVKADEELEARTNLDHLSEKLSSVKADEELEETNTSHQEARSPSDKEIKDQKDVQSLSKSDKSFSASKTDDIEDVKEVDTGVQGSDPSVHKQGEVEKAITKTGTFLDRKPKEPVPDNHSDDSANAEAQGDTEKGEELNWQQILLSGMEDGEKILLKEYTTILRNYKDIKKKLSEVEKKERDSQFDITLQMRELKKANLKKDEEIIYLRQRLDFLEADKDVKEDSSQLSSSSRDRGVQSETGNEDSDVNGDVNNTPITNEDDKSKLIFIDRTPSISRVEEKLRTDIDAILDENLDFWLRFSTAFHQIQKFKTEVKDLQVELSKLKEKRKPDGSFTTQIKSEVLPIYKHLREIQTELTVWLEQSVSLKDELKKRFASLCSIQEDITKALKEGVEEDEIRFSTHQAAKLQGEILNMKQENNKVREELQAGLDHVSILQLQIEKTLRNLNEDFGISSDQPGSLSRPRVPLRSFIFGTKPKKQKNSIFSSLHPNRRYQILRAGIRLSNHSSS